MTKKKINYWKIATFVLIIFLAYMFGTSGFTFSSTGNAVASDAVSFVNTNLLQGQATATVTDVSSESGIYKATLNIQGEPVDVYLTKDGKYLFLQAIDITQDPNMPDPIETEAQEIELKSSDHIIGDPNSDIVVIEYSDFECPFCQRYYDQTLSSIKSEYVDTGEIAFVYRHFPLNNLHPNAQKAAEASECAADQGMFWEYHDILFENQQALEIENLKQYASDLGLDTNTFNSCLDSGEKASIVNTDLQEGQQYGVTGTPATFINGQLISGAVPFQTIQQAIENEMA